MAETLFELTFLFECDSTGIAPLKEKLEEALKKERPQAEMKLTTVSSSAVELSLRGDRNVIDSAHGKLSKDVLPAYKSLRLNDDLGEELRIEGYRILAKLEPRLRRFINEAMTGVLGFSWWDKIADSAMKERVGQVGLKNQKSALSHHPLEFSEFEHLVHIITGELAHWTEHQQVTVSDLLQLLNGSADLNALKAEIAKRVKPESLWDTVFAKLFVDEQSWREAKGVLLDLVIPIRHKVSHHRPIRLYEIDELKKAAEAVYSALEAKHRQLQNQEQKHLHDQAKAILGRVQRKIPDSSVAGALRAMQEGMTNPAAEALRAMQERLTNPAAEAFRAMQQGMTNPAVEALRVMQEGMTNPAAEAFRAMQQGLTHPAGEALWAMQRGMANPAAETFQAITNPAVEALKAMTNPAAEALRALQHSQSWAADAPAAALLKSIQDAQRFANPMNVFADQMYIDDLESLLDRNSGIDLPAKSDRRNQEVDGKPKGEAPSGGGPEVG